MLKHLWLSTFAIKVPLSDAQLLILNVLLNMKSQFIPITIDLANNPDFMITFINIAKLNLLNREFLHAHHVNSITIFI